ncbi:MAG: hypothetical protein U1E87_00170 [Alphaproteobacteria bacterium]
MDRAQLRCLLNSGPSRVLDVRRLHLEQQLEPIFKIAKLNSAIFLKQSDAGEQGGREDLPPIPTKVYLPYDRRKPEDGGESFVFTPGGMRVAVVNLIGEKNINHEDLAADIEIVAILDRVPSFSPYLVRDALERASVRIPEGYLAMPDREAAMIKQRMRARLRPLVASAFGGGNKPISQTSIERLVQKLWELKDMDELLPLVQAFKIAPDQAPEIFYCWLGIAFFENEYIKLQPRLKKMAAWMANKSSPRELMPRGMLDHYFHSVTCVRKLLQGHWKRSLGILQDYTATYDELVGASAAATRFIAFLRQSKAHFWTLGGCLGRLDQSSEIWDQTCSKFNYETLSFDRGNELFAVLNLVNASGESTADLIAEAV